MRFQLIILSMVLAGFLFTNCQSTSMSLPNGFAKYKKSSSQFRAVSPGAVQVRAYTTKNEPMASLDVLTHTIQIHFKQIGYKIIRNEPITSKSGLKGRLFLTSITTMNGEYRYLVAFFPDDAKVHIVEAAGGKVQFSRYQEELFEKVKTVSR